MTASAQETEAAEAFRLLQIPTPPPLLLEEVSPQCCSLVHLSLTHPVLPGTVSPVLSGSWKFPFVFATDLSHWLLDVPPEHTLTTRIPRFQEPLVIVKAKKPSNKQLAEMLWVRPLAVPDLTVYKALNTPGPLRS